MLRFVHVTELEVLGDLSQFQVDSHRSGETSHNRSGSSCHALIQARGSLKITLRKRTGTLNRDVENLRVCVVGLGEVGLPTATYIKDRGVEVVGYDTDSQAILRARKKGIPAYENWEELPECTVYIVCARTRMNEDRPDLSAIYDVFGRIESPRIIPFSQ